MLPIGDDNSQLTRTPIVTYVLLGLNVIAFIYELTLGSGLEQFIGEWGTVPVEILRGEDLASLFTSMFLHAGWAHLIGNMFFLKIFGDNVEDRFGPVWFLIFYLVTGLVASLAHILLNPDSTIPSVGASGAISGILGAYIVFFFRNRVNVWVFYTVITVPAWVMIGLWAGEQFLATYGSIVRTEQTTGGVAYAAHAGGFLAGVILAFIARGISGVRSGGKGDSRYYR